MANRNTSGKIFSEEIIKQVWEKAEIAPGYDPTVIRRDTCGALVRRDLFNKKFDSLSMGWQIDHIKPVSLGGTDDLVNLQLLQWENNFHKGNAYPSWDCLVGAEGEENQYLKN